MGATLNSPELREIIALVLPLQFTGLAVKHYPNMKEVEAIFGVFC